MYVHIFLVFDIQNEHKSNNFQISVDQFKTAMTADEKAKLFQAIGYHEDGVQTELPIEYVAIKMEFNLNMLEICIKNTDLNQENRKQTVLSLQINGVSCQLDQRPAASGIK